MVSRQAVVSALALLLSQQPVGAFVPTGAPARRSATTRWAVATPPTMTVEPSSSEPRGAAGGSRRDALGRASSAVAALAAAAAAPAGVLLGAPAAALASSSSEKAQARAAEYGLPPLPPAKDGFSQLLSIYGRANSQTRGGNSEQIIREPIFVSFNYPGLWITKQPLADMNGETGTISANDFQKGDSLTFFLGDAPAGEVNKKYVAQVLEQAVTQKGSAVQSFKVKKIEEGETNAKGEKYIIAQFEYEIITESNFIGERKGWSAITTLDGKSVECLVGVTTAARYKQIGEDLGDAARSFRVYGNVPKYLLDGTQAILGKDGSSFDKQPLN